jgi:hypothetical protein
LGPDEENGAFFALPEAMIFCGVEGNELDAKDGSKALSIALYHLK